MKYFVDEKLDGFLESVISERGGVSVSGKYYFPLDTEFTREKNRRNVVVIPGIFPTDKSTACELTMNKIFNIERPRGLVVFDALSDKEIQEHCKAVMLGKPWRLNFELGVIPMYSFFDTWSIHFDVLFDAFRAIYSNLLKVDYTFRMRDYLVGGNRIHKLIEYLKIQNASEDDLITEFGTIGDKLLEHDGKELGRLYKKTIDGRYGNIIKTDNIYIRPFLFTTIFPTILIWSIFVASVVIRYYSSKLMYLADKFRFKKEFPVSNLMAIGSLPLFLMYALSSVFFLTYCWLVALEAMLQRHNNLVHLTVGSAVLLKRSFLYQRCMRYQSSSNTCQRQVTKTLGSKEMY